MTLDLILLNCLDLIPAPNMAKRNALLADARMESEEEVTLEDFKRSLRVLEKLEQVRIDSGDVVRVAITARGRNRVAEAR